MLKFCIILFQRLQSRCCSKASVDLCEFLLLRGWGSYYSNAHSSVVHLDFDMVTMETVFRATPIPPVPILLTALSKNLAGPMSLSHMQGTTKTGLAFVFYVSMRFLRCNDLITLSIFMAIEMQCYMAKYCLIFFFCSFFFLLSGM